jgi:hypothetical protein
MCAVIVVALTRWGQPPEQELAVLAALLAQPVDELAARCRLPPPVLLARVEEETAALPLLAVLRDRGHGAVACAESSLATELGWLVAVARWARPADDELSLLASVFGVPAAELRGRAARPLPAVLARWLDRDTAAALVAVLRDRGHGAVAEDVARVGTSAALLAPRHFALEADALVVRRDTQQRRLPWTALRALVRTPPEDPAAASLAGLGERLYVVVEPWAESLLLDEASLQYGGLGRLRLGTVRQNFITLVDQLRQRAPAAWYDERLVRERARPARLEPPHPLLATTAGLRATATDLAVHLLLRARAEDQLGASGATLGVARPAPHEGERRKT